MEVKTYCQPFLVARPHKNNLMRQTTEHNQNYQTPTKTLYVIKVDLGILAEVLVSGEIPQKCTVDKVQRAN